MSLPECFQIMGQAGDVLDRPEGAAEARRLIESGASTAEVIEAFARLADPTQIAGLREEMQELPETTVSSILGAWMLASAANKPLRLTSVAPDRPLEAARAARGDSRHDGGRRRDGRAVTHSRAARQLVPPGERRRVAAGVRGEGELAALSPRPYQPRPSLAPSRLD